MEAIAWRHFPGDINLQNLIASESLFEISYTYFDGEV
jgi:hypothetical protein